MRTFVCIVPETRRQVTTDKGESLQRKSGSVLDDRSGSRGRNAWATCAFRPHLSLLPCDVTYAISPSAIP